MNPFEGLRQITADILYKTKPGLCYTLITDTIHQSILFSPLFRSIDQATYFIIFVPDAEDMLQPSDEIVLSLQEARRSGCQTYLMYLANGIQMERFLRYIDQ